MPEMTSYAPGAFCWIDLQTTDAAGAKAFYAALGGWEFMDDDMGGGMVYTHCRLRGLEVAGLAQMQPETQAGGMPSVWTSYVAVASADDAAARAAELGGRVRMEPATVGPAGRLALLQDSEGAAFGVWEAGEHAGAGLVNEPVSLSWNELATRDADAAQRFYGGLFGWTYETVPAGAIEYTTILNDGRPNGGMLPIQLEWGELPPSWSAYLAVADGAAALETVRSLGGQVHVEGRPTPAGDFSLIQDPQGAFVNLIELVAPG